MVRQCIVGLTLPSGAGPPAHHAHGKEQETTERLSEYESKWGGFVRKTSCKNNAALRDG